MTQVFKNNAAGRLVADITATATAIRVLPGEGAQFPVVGGDNFCMITIEDRRTGLVEITKCTGRSGDILTVVRAQEGTTARPWVMGATVSNRLTAGTIENYITPPPGSIQYFFNTRDQFVAALSVGGFVPVTGWLYVAGNHLYIGKVGATDIPDLPGVLPFGDVHVEHFGAKADMTFTMFDFGGSNVQTGGTIGPKKSAGTDQLAKFMLADNYVVNVTKTGIFFAEDGGTEPGGIYRGYYIASQFILQGKLISRNEYRNFIWLHNSNVYHSNIWINNSTGGIVGFTLIDQYARTVPKPMGTGQMGPGITAGVGASDQGGPAFASIAQQVILTNIEIDCKFCRAGTDGVGIVSAGAYHVFFIGGHEYSKIKLGLWGQTNRESNGLGICHWGCWYEPGPNGGHPFTNYADMILKESYHSCHVEVEIMGHIDMFAAPHGLRCVFEFASAGHCSIGDVSTRGCFPLAIQPGDEVDFYTVSRQKEKIMNGMRAGMISAIDCPLKGIDNDVLLYGNAGGANFITRGFGTSKFNNSIYETTTDRNICRQIEVDVVIQGFNLRRETYPPAWGGRGIFVQGAYGRLAFGAITTYGIGRGIEIEYCDGDQSVNYVEGDGSILYEFSRGGRLLQTDTNKDRFGYVENPADGVYRPGIGPGTRAVSIAGGQFQTVVAAPIGKVHTTIKTYITPFSGADDDVYKGTPIKIGTHWVTTTEFIQGRSNTTGYAYITAIAKGNPTVVTAPGNGFKNGIVVGFSSVVGMTQINGLAGTITVLNEDQFSVNIDSTAFSTYTGGGKATPQLSGVGYISHTPLPIAAVDGQAVIVDETCRVKQLSLTSNSSESSLRAQNAAIDNVDMHGVRSAGRYAANLLSARISVSGQLPLTIGRNVDVANNFTILADPFSLASVRDGLIPKNEYVAFHLKTNKDTLTGSIGHFDVRNCRVEDIATLCQGNDSLLRYALTMSGNQSTSVNQLLAHPARQGFTEPVLLPGPPAVATGGYYHFADDGMVNCWIRGVSTSADGKLRWVFPAPFNGGGNTVAISIALRTTVAAPRSFYVTSQNSTECTINCASAEVITIDVHAVGRWFAEA